MSANYKSPHYSQVSQNNHRARVAGLTGQISIEEWEAVLAKYEHRCAVCGVTGKLTMDHIIPLVWGGQHCVENLQPLCKSCNSKKSDTVPEGTPVPDTKVVVEERSNFRDPRIAALLNDLAAETGLTKTVANWQALTIYKAMTPNERAARLAQAQELAQLRQEVRG